MHYWVDWRSRLPMIAWAIAIAIMLNALGVFAIRLAIAYAITKKANHND
ncbi:MAG: hypothetical protein LKH59_07310 [Lactobacillus crispatus]|nr:hypothetical protein [Lactobacillus crispatus]MCI1336280.1 hypothetical protein [Lactobacillus crispatus]MCI1365773.1 hypothetical protein [Lactobacillus crispatus]MCI1494155.1 hypothetical protein [Lactobacillus crispatus]MCI1524599.1 hypothetical protein [Lactobacillus crispatus]